MCTDVDDDGANSPKCRRSWILKSTMMGLQATASSNKRKYEELSASTDEQHQQQQQQQQNEQSSPVEPATQETSNQQNDDGASPPKSPRLEESAVQPEQESAPLENSAEDPISTQPSLTATSSSTSSITTTATTASPLIAGTPTIPINTPLILPPAPPSAEDSIAKLEAVAVPGETGWNCEPIVDPISKLQAVAVPGEAWGSDSTRSTLATTLLAADDLDDDDDDFEDDFDDDETILPSYPPIRYPCSPNRGGYIPAYPKPGYFPEPYQNCSRMNGGSNNGAQQYANRGYGWSQHGYYSPPYEAPSTQQTIRCAENGKSYFELGSANYSNVNNQFGAQGRHLKRCCDGRNMSCNNKQCYKERRLKMMNLSMFKLARFRQASDQSLYRSVLICNTLKSIEREIDNENKEFSHQQHLQQQHPHHYHAPPPPPPPHHLHHPHPQQQPPPPPPQQPQGEYYGNSRIAAADNKQQQQAPKFSDISNNGSYSRLQGSNTTTQSSPSSYGTSTGSSAAEPSTITTQLSPYDQQPQQHPQLNSLAAVTTASTTTAAPLSSPHHHHHPLKDPQSGRATPFPSSSSLTNGYHDGDSGFGDDDCTRPINWGSVLSLSSQSALDPLNNNDLFVTSPSVVVSVVNDSHHHHHSGANVTVLASNDDNCDSSSSLVALSQSGSGSGNDHGSTTTGLNGVSNSDSSSESNHHPADSTSSASSSSGANSSSTTTLTSLTTLTTSSHCDLNLTTLTTSPSPLLSSCASALQYHSSTNGSSWDLAYLDMDLGTTHELYDMFPNCYKITSFNSDVDMLGLKSPMLEPSKVVCDNDMDSFTTHIMVGS